MDAETAPPVGVVMVHWEGSVSADTEACLRSLAAVEYPSVRAYLVNNGAVTFPEDRFRAAYPGLTILTSPENLGFTGGNNLGIRAALADGARYVLLLNNDTLVSPDLLAELLPAFGRPEVGIAGPIITYADRPDRAWFAGGRYNHFLGYTFQTQRDDGPAGRGQDAATDFVTGCALLARREVFERVGLFWDALFLYFEDVELCLRAGRAGYRCVLVAKPLVRHKVSASMGVVGDHPFSAIKGYYLGRNPLLLLQRGATGAWTPVSMLGLFAVIYPYNILQCVKARNWPALRAYLRGIRDGIFGRHGPQR